ncbi:hypothetical protein [Pseudanabaena sp. UWO311]|uniref:hypothetical protein n=1 Tax=Pseudanabaena sp. UWO311 TaxID=2487337 RepID=UPI00167FEAD1|nr:hypothetical protein [Pseudanabaena sp. UWO311]
MRLSKLLKSTFFTLYFWLFISITEASLFAQEQQLYIENIEKINSDENQESKTLLNKDIYNLQFATLKEIEDLNKIADKILIVSPSMKMSDRKSLPIEEFIASPKKELVMTDYAVLESMIINYQTDDDKNGQYNQIIEPTWKLRFKDDTVISFQTGFNSFNLSKKRSIYNTPLQFGIGKKLGSVNLNLRAGIDIYDRLATTANIEVNASIPVLNGVTLFGFFEQRPYKSNVNTLENQIKIRRFGPNIYWQIDPNTALFSLYRWGDYNDGNTDQQSFSRLERKFGQFAIAANLFTWFYEREATPNTYFSPRDFLVYTGELSWQGDIFNFLNCRLAISSGEQRVDAIFSPASSYQAKCVVKVSPNIEADLGYAFSNVRKSDTGDSSKNETISGQLRMKF